MSVNYTGRQYARRNLLGVVAANPDEIITVSYPLELDMCEGFSRLQSERRKNACLVSIERMLSVTIE
jgi:hypothetical protein